VWTLTMLQQHLGEARVMLALRTHVVVRAACR
jgi:hypothetical protein